MKQSEWLAKADKFLSYEKTQGTIGMKMANRLVALNDALDNHHSAKPDLKWPQVAQGVRDMRAKVAAGNFTPPLTPG